MKKSLKKIFVFLFFISILVVYNYSIYVANLIIKKVKKVESYVNNISFLNISKIPEVSTLYKIGKYSLKSIFDVHIYTKFVLYLQ